MPVNRLEIIRPQHDNHHIQWGLGLNHLLNPNQTTAARLIGILERGPPTIEALLRHMHPIVPAGASAVSLRSRAITCGHREAKSSRRRVRGMIPHDNESPYTTTCLNSVITLTTITRSAETKRSIFFPDD